MRRFFDFIAAFLALLLLSPVIAVIALKIRKNLGCPVFFRQVRPGKNCKPFEILKFRTMRDSVDESGFQLPDSERLTSFGIFLRSTSLDELPELWNVLKGEMSLIGPRPLLMEYVSLYNYHHKKRHNIRPGITGWAQVNGRNTISWEEKFNLDVWYVENQNFWLDIKIIWMTIKKVIAREGISADDEATMPKFSGYKEL